MSPTLATPSTSDGTQATKATKSRAREPPNCSTTPRLRSNFPISMATRPPSKPNGRLLQQPARADRSGRRARLIANHPNLALLGSRPEVGTLHSPEFPGFDSTMPQSDPARLSPEATLRLRPPTGRVSLVTRITLRTRHVPYAGRPDRIPCQFPPRPAPLSRAEDRPASSSTASRPTRTLLTLRPIELFDRPGLPLSRGFGVVSRPVGTACRPPHQSTTLWVEASTGDAPSTRTLAANVAPRSAPLAGLDQPAIYDHPRRRRFTPPPTL